MVKQKAQPADTTEELIAKHNATLDKKQAPKDHRFTVGLYKITRVIRFNGKIITDVGHPQRNAIIEREFIDYSDKL